MLQVKIKSGGPENGQPIDIDKNLVLVFSIVQKFARWGSLVTKLLNTAQCGTFDLLECSSQTKISNEDSKTDQHMSLHVLQDRVLNRKQKKCKERIKKVKDCAVKGCKKSLIESRASRPSTCKLKSHSVQICTARPGQACGGLGINFFLG